MPVVSTMFPQDQHNFVRNIQIYIILNSFITQVEQKVKMISKASF